MNIISSDYIEELRLNQFKMPSLEECNNSFRNTVQVDDSKTGDRYEIKRVAKGIHEDNT